MEILLNLTEEELNWLISELEWMENYKTGMENVGNLLPFNLELINKILTQLTTHGKRPPSRSPNLRIPQHASGEMPRHGGRDCK